MLPTLTADTQMTQPAIAGVSPFFIVADLAATLSFYSDMLGFEVTFRGPAGDEFFGIVRRDGAMIMFKELGIEPLPNYTRQPEHSWDAYLSASDPDALAAEFASRGVPFSAPLTDRDDGLRGFEVKDTDGYGLFFGCPRGSR